jgi:hypothetical protein
MCHGNILLVRKDDGDTSLAFRPILKLKSLAGTLPNRMFRHNIREQCIHAPCMLVGMSMTL